VIWIYREDVKPARTLAHQKVERGFTELWTKANTQPFLGLEAVSGNATETVFISGYDSMAAFEKDFQMFQKTMSGQLKSEYESLAKQEAELLNGVHSSIAVLRPDLGYKTESFMGDLPKARYTEVLTMRVRPGKGQQFAEGAKMFQQAYQKANIARPWVVYQILSGAPEGTYLIFAPLKSLGELDEMMAMQSKIREAIGEENLRKLDSGDVLLSEEMTLYALNPEISHVSREFAAIDPDFWSPAPSALAKATTDKSTGKKKQSVK
jgi:hypothetical protein